MEYNEVSLTGLPPNREEAFVFLEHQLRETYLEDSQNDRDAYVDQNGGYCGDYKPERTYVTKVMALLDELDLEIDVPNIVDFSLDNNQNFQKEFLSFQHKIIYANTRFELRKARMENDSMGTVIMIRSGYKDEIGGLLRTIRKIVNQEITDIEKKDRIFKRISSLQLEIDRDKTTIDALFRTAIDLTRTIGECAENLEPLLDKVERMKKLIWDNTKPVNNLPDKSRQRLIETQTEGFDDEIPF